MFTFNKFQTKTDNKNENKTESKSSFGKNPNRIDQCYGCRIINQEIIENKDLKLPEPHESGKTNNDVVGVYFENCTTRKVPQGLTKIFPNMRILEIWNSKLNKIDKQDLVEYKNIKKFRCEFNELDFLPGDLFDGFGCLEFISFNNNKIKTIEPNILDGLEHLKYVDLRNNLNYNLFYSIYPENKPNTTLEEIKSYIFGKFCDKFEIYKNLKKSEENSQREIQQLKDLNAKLHQEKNLFENSNTALQLELKQEKIKRSIITSKFQTGIFGDLTAFIQDDSTKDFHIQISDRTFPVHKFLLAARSPTLAEIFKNNSKVENLNLVDISVENFEKILQFLYTNEVPEDDGTNYLHLFAAAGKLKIKELKEMAATKLIGMIIKDNALEILKLSNRYNHDELRDKAFEVLKTKYPSTNFREELSVNMDLLDNFMILIKRKEDADKEMEEMFQYL